MGQANNMRKQKILDLQKVQNFTTPAIGGAVKE